MYVTKLTVTEIIKKFSEYINRIIYKHEKFILVRGKKPVAELKPVPSGISLSELPALLLTLPELTNEEADSFLNDIKESRNKLKEEKVRDPWES